HSEPERALALAREALALSPPGEHNEAYGIAADLAARQGHRRDALAYCAQAIDTYYWIGNRVGLGAIIGSVAVLLADHDPDAAAVLQGARDAVVPEYTQPPHMIEAEQHTGATLDARLGVDRRNALYTQGMAMNDGDAVAYAHAAIARSLADETT